MFVNMVVGRSRAQRCGSPSPPHPGPHRLTRFLEQAHGEHGREFSRGGQNPYALGGPGFCGPKGFPWGPLCHRE